MIDERRNGGCVELLGGRISKMNDDDSYNDDDDDDDDDSD